MNKRNKIKLKKTFMIGITNNKKQICTKIVADLDSISINLLTST